MPQSAQWLAGARTEPSVLVPSAKSHSRLDTAEAEPDDEPPAIRSGTAPFTGAPKCALMPFIERRHLLVECDAPNRDALRGSIVTHRLPGLDLSVVRSRAQRVMRTPRAIGSATDDYIIVSLQTQGNAVISQDGREATMAPDDFATYDSTRPYTCVSTTTSRRSC